VGDHNDDLDILMGMDGYRGEFRELGLGEAVGVVHTPTVQDEHEMVGDPRETNIFSRSSAANREEESSFTSIPRRNRRIYPPAIVKKSISTGFTGNEPPRKWIHWCVDAAKTHLLEICVEAPEGARRGSEFIQELKRGYRRVRGLRFWFSLRAYASVKVIKVILS
jgi:hypothetical protein